MKHAITCRRPAVVLIVSLLGAALALFPAPGAALAEPKFVIRPVAEKRIAQLPAGDLFWLVENFPSLTAAKAAEGPLSMAFEAGGKAWLVTLGPKNASTAGGSTVAQIGPLPRITASEYMLRVTNSGGPPGAKTPVHTHPGPEAFYVLAGRMGQRTPHGVAYAEANQPMNGHGADTPMQVFNAGDTDLDQIVMFVVDAARPFSQPAKLE
ncbi:MAG TPA: hypothetical protein VNL18_11400 [Gemmatimonadales bacterium]|nr:hypothetical protein [Gemmatimonadales bacterium]